MEFNIMFPLKKVLEIPKNPKTQKTLFMNDPNEVGKRWKTLNNKNYAVI